MKATSSNFRARLLSWFTAGPTAFDVARIFFVSAVLAFFLLYCGSFWLETGAASYQDWANALTHGGDLSANAALQWRDIGYALVLVAGGFPFTDSFLGTVVIQTLMGISMPILVYFTLRPWFPMVAYYTGMASAFSLAPFLMIKTIHHDQPYIFFTILSLCLFNQYIATKRPIYIYALTFAMFGVALHRLLGRYFYALLVLIAAAQRRVNFQHYIVGFLIFALGMSGYLEYRQKALGYPPSILGQQVFQNVYLNSAEFGRPLTPDIGPSTRLLMEHVYKHLLPSPAEAPNLKDGPSTPEFMRKNVYRYTADELLKKIFQQPNYEYQLLIYGSNSDDLLLKAAIEIALARPLFVLQYTLRNFWKLLYDPGWGHSRFTIEPYARAGLIFPMGGPYSRPMGDTLAERAPPRALKELEFIELVRQPAVAQDIYYFIESIWHETYTGLARIFLGLMMITWTSIVIGLLARATRWPKLRSWSRLWISEQVVDSSLAISMLFFANVGITALLVEPQFRYDFSLLILKIMLSGIGVSILLGILQHFEVQMSFRFAHVSTWPHRSLARAARRRAALSSSGIDGRRDWSRWRILLTSAAFTGLLAIGFGNWILQVDKYALRNPADHTIHVKSAQCLGWDNDFMLRTVRSACSGERQCNYLFDPRDFDNMSCGSILRVEWTCSQGGPVRRISSPPLPESRTKIQLSCE